MTSREGFDVDETQQVRPPPVLGVAIVLAATTWLLCLAIALAVLIFH